jgi:hypothetical protein
MTFRVRGPEAEEELHAARDQADLTLSAAGRLPLYQGEAVPHKPLRRLYGEYPRPAFGCHRRRSGLRTNEVGCMRSEYVQRRVGAVFQEFGCTSRLRR